MDEGTYCKEFFWTNVFFKVEDTLFSVPRCEFEQSSEVFAGMFILPSGPSASVEGGDKEHPIVLEGYKKDDFACLLKVMYPTARSLISGTNIDLVLTKEEWVSVLKLSTIWNMKQIREYAIHRLSTDMALSAIDKINLARAHKFAGWLEEGVTCLVNGDHVLTREELSTLGWETASLILWIKDQLGHSVNNSNTLRFRKDMIKCGFCTSSASLFSGSHNCFSCGYALLGEEELTCAGSSTSGAAEIVVALRQIACSRCGYGSALYNSHATCSSCSATTYSQHSHNVRITLKKPSKQMIQEVFGDEIEELTMSVT
ncbi:hypothetical protein GALMADRAFT_229463 [Galerina marginata CBS 339.88]|uniref:BTB domain-containing protein n=1 Tax=Galerina marginata (strain CBS 339.88) TaxID=685588 RepID=A0A067SNA7_GALM3|nr:hypothetical protein GALMADRAFT_229463 [Galerina marginata CBS 339.88]